MLSVHCQPPHQLDDRSVAEDSLLLEPRTMIRLTQRQHGLLRCPFFRLRQTRRQSFDLDPIP
jgi:hypothetical protein